MALKTVFVGASTTGKTTIVKRIITKTFFGQSDCTIGASFIKHTSNYDNKIKYDFWDTAGQERFNSLLPMYFKGAKILIFVFNVSDLSTANDFDRYIRVANDHENLKILIVGNKLDLIEKDEQERVKIYVTNKFGDYGINNKIWDFVFMSAKTGENFDSLTKAMDKCAQTIEVTPHFDPAKILLNSKDNNNDDNNKEIIDKPNKCSC